MNFDQKDIEAVAKARVARKEGNKGMYFFVLGVALAIAGMFVSRQVGNVGWLLAVGGAGLLLWYMYTLAKKQNVAKEGLLLEWQKEQKSKQVAK